MKLRRTLEQAGSRAARGEAVFPAECGHGCERGLRQCAHTPGLLRTELCGWEWCAVAGLASVAHVLFYGGLIPRGLLPHSTRR